MTKTILIIAKDDVNVSRLMADIFRQFEPRIMAISNSADPTEAINQNMARLTLKDSPPRDYPFFTGDYKDGEEG
ncbi:MAG: hypothetical protein OEQ39_00015 [Gammaproteobacteria bacterium]|nr:hypothetical protein [Gammaproteobacteria bacterium]